MKEAIKCRTCNQNTQRLKDLSIKSDLREAKLTFNVGICDICDKKKYVTPLPLTSDQNDDLSLLLRTDLLKKFDDIDSRIDFIVELSTKKAMKWAIKEKLIQFQLNHQVEPKSNIDELGLEIIAPEKHKGCRILIGKGFHDDLDWVCSYITKEENGELLLEGESSSAGTIVLLEGPSGVGKSTFSYHVGERLQKPVVVVSGGDVYSRYQGDSAKKIIQIFQALDDFKAQNGQYPILYLNEFDAISNDPDSVNVSGDAGSVNAEINRLMDAYRGPILIDTNHVDRLSKSHASLSIKLKFSLPDQKTRLQFIEAKWPTGRKPIEAKYTFVKRTTRYSFRDLEKILKLLLVRVPADQAVKESDILEILKVVTPQEQLNPVQYVTKEDFSKKLKELDTTWQKIFESLPKSTEAKIKSMLSKVK